jgi:hypothetical protein
MMSIAIIDFMMESVIPVLYESESMGTSDHYLKLKEGIPHYKNCWRTTTTYYLIYVRLVVCKSFKKIY